MDNNYVVTPNGDFISESELYHHGIRGMKWGIRRYQNADGSLTAAGKKRYINPDGTLNKRGQKYYAKESERLKNERRKLTNQKKTNAQFEKLDAKRKANADLKDQLNPKKPETPKKKSISEMSDEELNEAISRARMEDAYRQLRPEPVNEKSAFMKKFVKDVATPALMDAGKKALSKMVENAMKDKVDPNSYEALKKKYDTLTIKKKLETLQRGEDPEAKEMSWDDKIKKQQYEANKRKYEQEESERAAKAANEAKKEAERVAKEAREAENRRLDDLIKQSKNKKPSSYNTAEYEKKVDKILEEMDNAAWERWHKEYGGR